MRIEYRRSAGGHVDNRDRAAAQRHAGPIPSMGRHRLCYVLRPGELLLLSSDRDSGLQGRDSLNSPALGVAGFGLITAQAAILLTLLVGWGYWLRRSLPGDRTDFPFTWFFFGLGGYILQLSILEIATRLGVPVRVSTWPILAFALAGVAATARRVPRWWP